MTINKIRNMFGKEFVKSWEKHYRELMRIDEPLTLEVNRIIHHSCESSGLLGSIDALLSASPEDLSSQSGGNPLINTYPYGVKTNKLFTRFLAICRGKTRSKTVLNRIISQCRKMSRHFPSEEPKTVFLLTDKWDSNTFGEYEAELLNYALHDNIRFVFLLVTDYGVTQIPFLPNDRDVFKSHEIPSNEEIITIENNIPMNVLLEKLRISPFRFSYHAGPLNIHNNMVYFFNIDDLTWIKRIPMGFDFYSEPIAEGGIEKTPLEKFLISAQWLADEKLVLQSHKKEVFLDSGRSELEIFGITIDSSKSYTDMSGAYSDKQIESLISETETALNELINNCEANIIREY
ncbi:MAG: hypothetical protein ACI4XF_02070 [Oscillospiraceae bacterium]